MHDTALQNDVVRDLIIIHKVKKKTVLKQVILTKEEQIFEYKAESKRRIVNEIKKNIGTWNRTVSLSH